MHFWPNILHPSLPQSHARKACCIATKSTHESFLSPFLSQNSLEANPYNCNQKNLTCFHFYLESPSFPFLPFLPLSLLCHFSPLSLPLVLLTASFLQLYIRRQEVEGSVSLWSGGGCGESDHCKGKEEGVGSDGLTGSAPIITTYHIPMTTVADYF